MSWTRFDPTTTFVRAPVRIVGLNGVEWLGMALDTGSNRTVLGELAAIRLGYDLLSAPTVRIVTASGVAEVKLTCPPNFHFWHSGGRISRLGHATANTVACRRSFGLGLFEASELVLQF